MAKVDFYFIYRRSGDGYRVWRNNWIDDQFEVLSRIEFEALELLCQRFSLDLIEADDD